MTENKLPTKSELRVALQEICDRFNLLKPSHPICVYDAGGDCLCVQTNGIYILTFPCCQDIKAPAKFKLVLIRISGKTELAMSTGALTHGGCLDCRIIRGIGIVVGNWYCPETGERHNWDDDWTPGEYRNENERETRKQAMLTDLILGLIRIVNTRGNMPVNLEGCECFGPCHIPIVMEDIGDGTYCLITRTDAWCVDSGEVDKYEPRKGETK